MNVVFRSKAKPIRVVLDAINAMTPEAWARVKKRRLAGELLVENDVLIERVERGPLAGQKRPLSERRVVRLVEIARQHAIDRRR